MRVERVGLEHHRDIAGARRQIVDGLAADLDHAVADILEPGDHPQRRRLAAAGRTDQRDKLAILDLKIDAMHDVDIAVALDQLFECDGSHTN